jgi:hypothetical protein
MTTYATTQPISATIQIVSGDLSIEAGDGGETSVIVVPSNSLNDADVAAAEQTRVEYDNGTLRVIGAKGRGVGLLRKPGSVRVTVSLPTGSRVDAATGLGRITSSGHLGPCHIRSGAGVVQFADAASLDAVTGMGAITAQHVSGDARCVTGSGSVRVTRVDGRAHVRNSNGDTWIGSVQAALTVKASNGSIIVDRTQGDVRLATANGDVTVGSVARGTVVLKTALGRVEIGIADGTAARLDLHTSYGSVVNELEATARPNGEESTVVVNAQTSAGDIVVRRAAAEA